MEIIRASNSEASVSYELTSTATERNSTDDTIIMVASGDSDPLRFEVQGGYHKWTSGTYDPLTKRAEVHVVNAEYDRLRTAAVPGKTLSVTIRVKSDNRITRINWEARATAKRSASARPENRDGASMDT